jgi:hypothetical protein
MIEYEIKNNDSTPAVCIPVQHSEILHFPAKFLIAESDFSPFAVKYVFWDISSTIKSSNKKYILSDLLNNISKIRSFAKLPVNWNDNGAIQFTQALINTTVRILQDLDYQPEIFPTGRDSILFEYGKPGGHYLGIEIFENRIETFIAPQRKTAKLQICELDELRNIVNDFND